MAKYIPQTIAQEGLQNHLGEIKYAQWRRLVGDDPNDLIITVAELGRRMGISRNTVYKLLRVDRDEHATGKQ